jgi:hypothetical protein
LVPGCLGFDTEATYLFVTRFVSAIVFDRPDDRVEIGQCTRTRFALRTYAYLYVTGSPATVWILQETYLTTRTL